MTRLLTNLLFCIELIAYLIDFSQLKTGIITLIIGFSTFSNLFVKLSFKHLFIYLLPVIRASLLGIAL